LNIEWTRQKGEPAAAYQAACIYFELGLDRTLKTVSERVGKTSRTVETWSAKWQWVKRASAWDNYHQNRKLEIEEDEFRKATSVEAEFWAKKRTELRKEALALGDEMLKRVREMMRFPLHEAQPDKRDDKVIIVKPVRWNGNTMINTLRAGIDLKCLATGLAAGTDPLDEMDIENASTEDLEAILKDQSISKDKRQ